MSRNCEQQVGSLTESQLFLEKDRGSKHEHNHQLEWWHTEMSMQVTENQFCLLLENLKGNLRHGSPYV